MSHTRGVQTYTQPVVTDERRRAAVMARDRRADGMFVYGVTSTGVFLPALLRLTASAERSHGVFLNGH